MLLRIVYKKPKRNIPTIGRMNWNFFILKRFLKGVKITKIKPARLLIKNLG